jgi:8-oxo-dGTP diphosphatase
MSIGKFYGGIGALIWSPTLERYLLLRRSPLKDYGAGAWECVTGRVDQGEGFEEAMHREVMEELGVNVDVIALLGTTHFYRGAPLPENELIGVVFLCSLDDLDSIRISPEHSELRWLNAAEVLKTLDSHDPSTSWARRLIARGEIIRKLVPHELANYYQTAGVETG